MKATDYLKHEPQETYLAPQSNTQRQTEDAYERTESKRGVIDKRAKLLRNVTNGIPWRMLMIWLNWKF